MRKLKPKEQSDSSCSDPDLVRLEREAIGLGSVKIKRISFYQSGKDRKEDSQSPCADKFKIQVRDQILTTRISGDKKDYAVISDTFPQIINNLII